MSSQRLVVGSHICPVGQINSQTHLSGFHSQPVGQTGALAEHDGEHGGGHGGHGGGQGMHEGHCGGNDGHGVHGTELLSSSHRLVSGFQTQPAGQIDLQHLDAGSHT